MGNRRVVESHRTMVQVADPRRVGIVCDRVKSISRNVEKKVMVWLVEKSHGPAFEVVQIDMADP
jgi:hypothetical protein